jgi:L-fucose isomerase-like protein
MRLGFAAIGRTTFDVALATTVADRARAALAGHRLVGPEELVTEAPPEPFRFGDVDAIVLLLATFADSTLPAAFATEPGVPVVLWGIPEARTGARLRLNSLCGINLAAYELRRRGADVRWVYAHPDTAGPDLEAALAGPTAALPGPAVDPDPVGGAALADALASSVVGLVGDPPDGFTPCRADAGLIEAVGRPRIDRIGIEDLFAEAGSADPSPARPLVAGLGGLDELDPDGVDAALRLHVGLRAEADRRGWDGVATRCWPECFTEFGAAACAAQGLLADAGIPATCEADVPGTLTALALRAAAGADPVVVDLVDVAEDGTMAFWHCGIAPASMAADPPAAVVHPNRGLPLLRQFRFRPGRVTVARLSASTGRPRLALGGGEIVDAPRPYHGTSGVVRMDRDGEAVLATVMAEGLDHHYGLVHGDVRAPLAGLADHLGLETVWL